MTYDPNKKEIWIISSNGFWREGSVNKGEHMIKKLCTWQEAKDYRVAFANMEREHSERLEAVKKVNDAERALFLSNSLA